MARGHIRRRKGPKGDAWEVRVYAGVDPLTAKERRVTRTVHGSKKDAEQTLTQLLGEVDGGGHTGPDGDFAGLVTRWLETCGPSWSPATRTDFDGYLRRHVLPALGPIPLRRLRPDDLEALYGRMLAAGLAPATARRAHTICHSALAQAVRWGWLPTNPADRAAKPKLPRRQLTVPAPAALRSMIDAADTELLAYLLLAADTGARRGEVSALRWCDLDLTGRTVTINRSVTTAGIVKGTKTDRGRQVALAERTVTSLESHRLDQAEVALGFGVKVPAGAHVFPHFDHDGFDFVTPWRPHSWSHRVRRLRTRLDLGPEVTIRNLRHYVATTMLTSGVDVRTVAGRLGHATPATTLNVYAHFQPAADRAAADILSKALDADD